MLWAGQAAVGGDARAPPRPRGSALLVTGTGSGGPAVHLMFRRKVKPARAAASERAFAAASGARGQPET